MNEPTSKSQPRLTVTGTLDDVLVWVRKMGEHGMYNPQSARFRRTAIEKFASVLGSDEPRTAAYMHENIDTIATRWMTKEKANPDTGTTYKSRALGALKDYLAYQENPQSMKPRVGPPRGSTAKKAAAKKEAKQPPEPESSPPKSEATPPGADLRTFRLGKDREPFLYAIPDGMTVADVIKIACHLVTMADDFDPMNANTSALFSLTRLQQGRE
jgi:hypothetical protein